MSAETPIQKVISRLKNVKRSGPGWTAQCPAHGDSRNSLGVDLIEGKVVLKCHAGCETENVVGAIGLGLVDLFSDEPKPREERVVKQGEKSCSLEALCRHKHLDRDFVCSLGWRETVTNGLARVEIPYADRDGKTRRVRHRFALNAKDGSSWNHGKELVAYEPDRGALAQEEGYVLIVEGETDTVTCLFAGIPAIGLPGATQAKTLQAHHVAGLKRVFVSEEPDAAGAKFVEGVTARLVELGYDGPIHAFKTPAAAKDPNTLWQRDPTRFGELMTTAFLEASKPPPEPLDDVWHTLEEWGSLVNEPPPRRWLLDRPDDEIDGRNVGVFPLGKVGMLVAAGGVGKTMALVELAISVATGRKWLDHFGIANTGRVLLALAEEDEEEINRRVYQAARAMRLTDHQVTLAAKNIVALPLAGTIVNLIKSDDGDTVETAIMAALKKKLEEGGSWRLVILDPLSRFSGFDSEKDNAAATQFVAAVESLLRAPGRPAVLLAHHTSKASRQHGAERGNAASARGASALTDGVRWQSELAPLADGTVQFAVTKTNYSQSFAPLILTRDADHGGYLRVQTEAEARAVADAKSARKNKDGENLRALVLRTVSELSGLRSAAALHRLLGGNRKALLETVRELQMDGLIELSANGFRLTDGHKP